MPRFVLVVDDDPAILKALRRLFRHFDPDVTVLFAQSGEAALDQVQALGVEVDVLVTDVIIPRISGPEIAVRFTHMFPKVKVIYISGGIKFDRSVPFLEKPIQGAELLQLVREALVKDSKP